MARYVVNVVSGGQTVSLLFVHSPSQLCSELLDNVRTRLPTVASKLGLTTTSSLAISLHADGADGPMVDVEYLLGDVLPDSKDPIFAVIEVIGHLTLDVLTAFSSWHG